MPAYHQMGHDSRNLLFEQELSSYEGAILSPVNEDEESMTQFINGMHQRNNEFIFIFDPQLYLPSSCKTKLKEWNYFPNDVETAALADLDWWNNILAELVETGCRVGFDRICSPVFFPARFSTEYYESMIQIGNSLLNMIGSPNSYQTILLPLNELAEYSRVMELASIHTNVRSENLYVIFFSDTVGRRELDNDSELKGAMKFIQLLTQNNFNISVGYSSADAILWKEAGARNCATGKYFNLRRFSLDRWDDEESEGRAISYMIEENLLGLFRDSDIIRLESNSLISLTTMNNPFYPQLRRNIDSGEAWLALSWRFYLYWFSSVINRIENSTTSPEVLIESADENWGIVEDNRIIFEERRNNGNWLRRWLRAVLEFQTPW